MKFDAKNSKLFGPIMAGLVAFFALDAETATETDIHDALEGADPLAKQLDAAKTQAIESVKTELDKMKAEFETMKGQVTDLETRATEAEKAVATKDARIAELQVEIAEAKTEVESAKAQSKTEVSNLSAQIAKLKAGKSLEDDVDESHAASKGDKGKGTEVLVIKNQALKNLITRKEQN